MARRAARRAPWTKRLLRWPAAGAAAWLGMRLFGLLSPEAASAAGGAVARTLGPRLPASDRARRNLAACFPDWPAARIEATVREMWDNLGRVAGEFPHLGAFDLSGADPRVEVRGDEIVRQLRDDGAPGLFFSAHIGNWELLRGLGPANDLRVLGIYRPMNAPLAERALRRAGREAGELAPKGAEGAMRIHRALRRGGHVAVMVDQRLNEGIEAPFFGRPARTAPTVAVFALRHRCPVVPLRVERLGGARFRIMVEPPLALPDSGDRDADILDLTSRINLVVEDWVRATPGQWFWLHRRWGK